MIMQAQGGGAHRLGTALLPRHATARHLHQPSMPRVCRLPAARARSRVIRGVGNSPHPALRQCRWGLCGDLSPSDTIEREMLVFRAAQAAIRGMPAVGIAHSLSTPAGIAAATAVWCHLLLRANGVAARPPRRRAIPTMHPNKSDLNLYGTLVAPRVQVQNGITQTGREGSMLTEQT
jgi:hypothetical protein